MSPVREIPSNALPAYQTGIRSIDSVRRAFLYDAVQVAGGGAWGAGDVVFFTVPLGGAGLAGAAKPYLLTNMLTAGQVPNKWTFEIWSIRIVPSVAVIAFADVSTSNLAVVAYHHAFLYGASFHMTIDNKPVLDAAPLTMLPAGAGLTSYGFANDTPALAPAAGGGAMSTNNGSPNMAASLDLDPYPIVIASGQTFGIRLNFPAAVAVAAAIGPATTWIELDGVLRKPA